MCAHYAMARGRESDLRTARAMRPARPCSRNHDAPGPRLRAASVTPRASLPAWTQAVSPPGAETGGCTVRPRSQSRPARASPERQAARIRRASRSSCVWSIEIVSIMLLLSSRIGSPVPDHLCRAVLPGRCGADTLCGTRSPWPLPNARHASGADRSAPDALVWRCGNRIELLALTDYMIANRRASRS